MIYTVSFLLSCGNTVHDANCRTQSVGPLPVRAGVCGPLMQHRNDPINPY